MDSTQNPTFETVHSLPSSLKSRCILHKTLLLQTVHSPASSQKSRWILHKTLPLQTVHNLLTAHGLDGFYTKPYCCKLFTTSPVVQRVQQNLLPNTDPANCSQPSQLPKVQQNSPPKPTSANCSQPPHFPRVQQDCQPHPAPASSTKPIKQTLILQAAFNLHRNLKLRQNSISTRLSRQ